ncbi:DUF3427 domain-containing protein [Corynebacterium guangdongense]|uniref:Superfamily II DNA or RNA helicase/HKD family nuclease n=1 Tax=Corynebacterium guangdongense TaxID=1783348 RepID=A0ABU1ZWB8_9CORY|nr:DUF3427 domain-containing protein [Corynebacterium guangdongense]MDR7329060.1 superfamily II DNA or RNA helicase/HKD family nuclease [Corynebacterium guangdongense]WJZ17630.1 type I restriction enzyme subunit R [Corynebacterium guangdongense]
MSIFRDQLATDLEFGHIDSSIHATQQFNPGLLTNSSTSKMLDAMITELQFSEEFVFSVAFITTSGLAALKEAFVSYSGKGTIVTSRYLDFNEPDMFRELFVMSKRHNFKILVHDNDNLGFHAKGYLFRKGKQFTAFVGSSNLTVNALNVNEEWNLRFSATEEGDVTAQIKAAIDRQLSRSLPLTEKWIASYEATRKKRMILVEDDQPIEKVDCSIKITPNRMQSDALAELDLLYEQGARRGVIISATGTGKTILAALAARAYGAKRVLFVVHREQILRKAAEEFKKVFQFTEDQVGFYTGNARNTTAPFIFATIQSISTSVGLQDFPRDAFDYIIIDEVHHTGAKSYQRLIDAFSPGFLLGVTATPERTDGFNVFELFDWNVPYEIRLQQALADKMLVPFHYYGISDYTVDGGIAIGEDSSLDVKVSENRVDYIVDKLSEYGHATGARGLIFCSSKIEAHQLSAALNVRELNGELLRTIALTGDDSQDTRNHAVEQLTQGTIDYILTVDIFNEGIDVPAINQIVMLRQTQSSIIFTQQLGRGLRKFKGKDHIRVIDFIGNYENNYLIPIALYGNFSANKDSIRRDLLDKKERPALPPTSTVSFDRISQRRILDSLEKVRLAGKREFRNAIQVLVDRLNHVPSLHDVLRFESIDPVLLASKYGNYWSLLFDLKFVSRKPLNQEAAYLTFISSEILNGMRPHELLLLRHLTQHGPITLEGFKALLGEYGAKNDTATVDSSLRVLTGDFYTRPLKAWGKLPVITLTADEIHLHEEFAGLFDAYDDAEETFSGQSFRQHVNDLLSTGLALNKRFHNRSGEFVIENRYTRKDVSRLLNWPTNQEATMYGYKVDRESGTAPVFVVYNKRGDVESQLNYADRFNSRGELRWYSRHGRTLASRELAPILRNELTVMLFVKKSDSEGQDFYYLGEVQAKNPNQEYLFNDQNQHLPVVSMDLVLEHPVDLELYDYLHLDMPDETSKERSR